MYTHPRTLVNIRWTKSGSGRHGEVGDAILHVSCLLKVQSTTGSIGVVVCRPATSRGPQRSREQLDVRRYLRRRNVHGSGIAVLK